MKRQRQLAIEASVAARHSLPKEISDRLRIYKDDEPQIDGQNYIAMEFMRTRRKAGQLIELPVAIQYAHANRMEEVFGSSEEMATFLHMAIKALPTEQQPALPEELAKHSKADEKRKQLRKASSLAERAAIEEEDRLRNFKVPF